MTICIPGDGESTYPVDPGLPLDPYQPAVTAKKEKYGQNHSEDYDG